MAMCGTQCIVSCHRSTPGVAAATRTGLPPRRALKITKVNCLVRSIVTTAIRLILLSLIVGLLFSFFHLNQPQLLVDIVDTMAGISPDDVLAAVRQEAEGTASARLARADAEEQAYGSLKEAVALLREGLAWAALIADDNPNTRWAYAEAASWHNSEQTTGPAG